MANTNSHTIIWIVDIDCVKNVSPLITKDQFYKATIIYTLIHMHVIVL